MPEPPRLRAGDRERDAVLAVLQEAHASGRLDLSELDERQGQVIAAKFVDELGSVVADLPEGAKLGFLRHPGTLAASAMPGSGLAPRLDATPAPVGPVEPVIIGAAVLGGRHLKPARGTQAIRTFQWWGGDNIDLTDALGPGVTIRFEAVAVMAGTDIIVPEGVRVIDNTINIMAGNSIRGSAQGDGSNGTLILSGFSWWAGHNVKRAKNKNKKSAPSDD